MNGVFGAQERFSSIDEVVRATTASGPRRRVLLLADDSHVADVVRDHVESFRRHSRHELEIINPMSLRQGWSVLNESFDVIIIHYSVYILSTYFLPRRVFAIVRDFPGPKLQIIQDEYRSIDRMAGTIAELGVDAVFSSLAPEYIQNVYHHANIAGVRFYSGLPGYIPERLLDLDLPPVSERQHHLVYRGRPLPAWLGDFAQEKVRIGQQGLNMAAQHHLAVDIQLREEDRLYGKSWSNLLMSAKAALAMEGGSTVFDFDGTIEERAKEYQTRNPHESVDQVWKAMVEPYEGNIEHKTLTPRVIESILFRTALVMYPGRFRGILEPWEHYIPLERDRSNETQVVEHLRDDAYLQNLTDRTYEYIANTPSLHFSHYISAIDNVVDTISTEQEATSKAKMRRKPRLLQLAPKTIVQRADRKISQLEVQGRSTLGRFRLRIITSRAGLKVRQVGGAIDTIVSEFHNSRLSTAPKPQTLPWQKQDALESHNVQAKNIMVLCDFSTRKIGTVRDHLDAFRNFSQHKICYVDFRTTMSIDLDFDIFDVVVLHYSLVITSEYYLPPDLVKRIHDYNGYKVLFIQDEYRWVNRTAAAIAELDIDVIYSVMNEEVIDQVYHHPAIASIRRKQTLTGYVPQKLTKHHVRPFEKRPVDVGYRARRAPGWLGWFAQEKWLIGHRFKQDAKTTRFLCDIAFDEKMRLYGRSWTKFLTNCKAVLGTESGASFIDFSGEVQTSVESYESANPDAPFEEIQHKYLGDQDGEIVIRVISPRCFEAAALRTLMILYPGDYSGILEPWHHYVPLERDHSNIEEVISVLHDPRRAQKIIDNAYNEIALNPRYSFHAMVEEFDRDLNEHALAKIADMPQAGPRTVLQRKSGAVTASDMEQQSALAYRLQILERRSQRMFWLVMMPTMRIKYWLLFAASWSIRILVPENKQHAVRNWLKATGARLGLLRLG